jgi:hypothetical protein
MSDIYYAVMPGGDKYNTRHAAVGVSAIRERRHEYVTTTVFAVAEGSELDATVDALSELHDDYASAKVAGWESYE